MTAQDNQVNRTDIISNDMTNASTGRKRDCVSYTIMSINSIFTVHCESLASLSGCKLVWIILIDRATGCDACVDLNMTVLSSIDINGTWPASSVSRCLCRYPSQWPIFL